MSNYWTLWFLAILVTFIVGEFYALQTHGVTLSRWVWNLSKRFPILPALVGLLVGGLFVHFWWGGMAQCF